MEKILKIIDITNEWIGRAMQILVIALILIGVTEVIQRYVFDHPTMWGPEVLIMIGATMYALSWGYIHKHQGHIRVDIFYAKLSSKGKLLTDIICFLICFLPVVGLLLQGSYQWMLHSWDINEKSLQTYWYPPLYPLRTAVFIGVSLFFLQGVVIFIRDLMSLVWRKTYD